MSEKHRLLNKGNKMKTIIFTCDLKENPIEHNEDTIILNSEAYYLDSEDDIYVLMVSMDEDFYLDLLIEKLKAKPEDDVYYTFNITSNINKILRENLVTTASNGVVVILSNNDNDLNYIEIIKNG